MTAGGFYERKTASPTSLALVIALHAGALGALALIKTDVVRAPPVITEIFDVSPEVDPPPVPPPPAPRVEQRDQVAQLDRPDVTIDLPPLSGPTVTGPPAPPPPLPPIGASSTGALGEASPQLPPLRIDAEFDPRFADAMQPPYPPSEQRAQREGSVRVRVTISANGRVTAVQRLSATSDAFWRATERHALARWRFRPATLDGRPVESTKVLTLHFQIEA